MPLYAYRCESGHENEEMRKYDERNNPGPPCEECGEPTSYVVSGGRPQHYRLKNLGGRPDKHNLKEI